MADWTTITDTQVDPDAPLTSGLGYAWRDNPIAIAEGATGAPRIVPLAMQTWHASVALDSTTTPVAVTGLDPNTMVQIMGSFGAGGTSTELQISVSSDGGTTWGGWVGLTTPLTSPDKRYSVNIVLNLNNGIYTNMLHNSGDLGGDINAIRFRHSENSAGAADGPARLAVWAIGRAP